MKREPGIRKDGRCYLCPKQRPILGWPYSEHADAFCSRACAERYFGTRVVDGKAA